MEGKSRIYSLRDSRGEPHVTVEVRPPDMEAFIQSLPAYERYKIGESVREKHFGAKVPPEKQQEYEELFDQAIKYKYGEPKPTIKQIKGKQNARPIEKYDPYTQDFVRSGEWSDVGDLKNTGLIRYEGKIMTQAEADDLLYKQLNADMPGLTDELGLTNPPARPPEGEGMKACGKVHVSDNCDCMRMELDNKKFAMGGAVANPNDIGSPSPQNSASPVASFQAGGAVKGLAAIKAALTGGKKSATAAKAAEAAYAPGVHYADPLQPPTMRMSEALGITGSEGKTLHLTEADRSRVFGPNRGGVGFSALQHYSEPHKEAKTVWGFGDANTTKKKINQNKDPEKSVWTTFAGSPTQHKSNTVVIKDAIQNLQIANEVGAIHPAQIDLINKRLRETVVKKTGKPLFPSDFDITDPQALEFAKTFDRRAAIGDVLLGTGVKGPMTRLEFKKANPDVKWSDSAEMQRLLDRETDPILREAATNDVGPHLFVLDNGQIERPDLNIAFPHQVTGTDLGVRYELAPLEVAVPDWMKQYKGRVDKSGNPSPVGYYDLARNQPQQFIDEKYLTNLQKSGNKAGGAIKSKAYQAGGAVKALTEFANAVRTAKAAKPAVKGMQEVLPAAEREANLKKFLKPSKVKQPVYHGTMSDVKEFRTPAYFGNKDVANQFADPEYLTGSDTLLAGESPNVMPVHLGLRKPKVFKTESDYEKHVMEGGLNVDKWKKKGYDSVIYAPEGNLSHEDAYFVAFEPQQVKSALGNRGSYDIKEAEINKRRGGSIHARKT
jgi:hypothetical protein